MDGWFFEGGTEIMRRDPMQSVSAPDACFINVR